MNRVYQHNFNLTCEMTNSLAGSTVLVQSITIVNHGQRKCFFREDGFMAKITTGITVAHGDIESRCDIESRYSLQLKDPELASLVTGLSVEEISSSRVFTKGLGFTRSNGEMNSHLGDVIDILEKRVA